MNLMQHITAIGFDLFETLITVENLRREEAVGRLMRSLKSSGLTITDEAFFSNLPRRRQTVYGSGTARR
jgi:predicted HAD superfamily phosphohydrolase YqeG